MKILLLVLLLTMSACGPGTYKLQEENDYFTLFNSDHDYTQGLMLSHENEARKVTVGQRIFTPVHKKVLPAPANERPYAGYLFSEYRKFGVAEGGHHPYTGVELGIVGPSSFGKQAQCGVHRLLSEACPVGWPDQLHSEPGIVLRAGDTHVQPTNFLFTKGELISNLQAEVGNISTALQAGTTVRYNLTSWLSLFAGPEMHLVARDIFLDGNTWQSSPSVNKEWFFSEVTGGFETRFPYLPVITWYLRIQSKQYEEQDGAYNYGGVIIEWEK